MQDSNVYGIVKSNFSIMELVPFLAYPAGLVERIISKLPAKVDKLCGIPK